MYCLVYRSKASAALGESSLQQMLEKSRESNKKIGITGCLLYHDGHFIQYFEGSQIMVVELFDKIKVDATHSDVRLLLHDFIETREFDTYMAFEYLRKDNSQLQYLKLLVSTFLSDEEDTLAPNPTSKMFWNATRLMLQCKQKRSYVGV